MIVVQLMGGLGNQLFQYACGRAISLRTGQPLFLDTSWCNAMEKTRPYALDKFNIQAETFHTKEGLEYFARKLKIDKIIVKKEKGSKFNPEILNIRDNVILANSNWQNEKYFSDVEKQIRKELLPVKGTISAESFALAGKMRKEQSVAVHIRRGDYLRPEHIKTFGVLSLEYYKKAIEFFNTKLENPQYYIFSDDMIWCQKAFEGLGNIKFVEHLQPINVHEDLWLMSQCKHNIIANSTYSWWGAWLNENNKKIVIAPEPWLIADTPGQREIIPMSWLQIPIGEELPRGGVGMDKLVILIGTGNQEIDIINELGIENVYCFCDNTEAGTISQGKPVISVDYLKKIYKDYQVMLSIADTKRLEATLVDMKAYNIPVAIYEEVMIRNDLQKYERLNHRKNFAFDENYFYPIWQDKKVSAGSTGVYFWQDLWAAKKIFASNPIEHYDIGSRIDGFISHLISFRDNVKLMDIRPMDTKLPGVDFVQCDATNLATIENNSIESLSALCSIEHFGLGRYGDTIDPEACFKCFQAIQEKIQPGGRVYISLPVGKEHVEFNAHRVFYAQTVIESFGSMKLLEYSTTAGENIEYNSDVHKYDGYTQKGGNIFGLFLFEKPNK